MRFIPQQVRWRLTLWYTLVLGVMILGFAGGAFEIVQRVLNTRSDLFLTEAGDSFSSELSGEAGEASALHEAFEAAQRDVHFRDIDFLLYDRRTHALVEGAKENTPYQLTTLGSALESHSTAHLITIPGGEAGFRVTQRAIRLYGAEYSLVGVQSRLFLQETLETLLRVLGLGAPVLLILGCVAGYLLARRALSPLSVMSRRTREITAQRLHERLPVNNPLDELGQLSTVVNELLARLEASFEQQRRFVADASHELRTPVSIIVTEADVAMKRARTEAEYRDALRVVQDASTRLSRIVNDLFLLARADAGRQPVHPEELYLDEVVIDATRAIRSLAANRGVQIHVDPLPEAPARGDPALLGRLLLNLLDNAVKYSPSGSEIRVSLQENGNGYDLRVADTGSGVPLEAQPHIFDRFYRVDSARSRADTASTSGAGLGLAIARWIAESHGGRLDLVRSDTTGSEFSFQLPRVATEPRILTTV